MEEPLDALDQNLGDTGGVFSTLRERTRVVVLFADLRGFTRLAERKLPYDAEKSFAPVTLLVSAPMVLAVHSSLAVNNVKELIAHAKAHPGQLSYASGGSGDPVEPSIVSRDRSAMRAGTSSGARTRNA